MNIVIHNYLSGSFLLEREPGVWDAIVILDSGISHTDFVAQHARRHLYLRFDDVDSDIPGKRTPTAHDIQSALDFATQSQNLMVCCRAGQSRSAATAFLVCHERIGVAAARQLLNPRRHIPNSLVIDLGARLIDNLLVLQTFAEWQAENKHIRLSNHLDDIERDFDELERQGARNRIVEA
ncbi:MAG: dual specificity protein phosphatase family protein [Planctomycetaceae bacterium]|nr:dual specificity protein phosphatase family protein [Planctomycetaceae bacterium]